MRKHICTLLIFLIADLLSAQSALAGRWDGNMRVLGADIPVRLRIPEHGNKPAYLDVIGQGVSGLLIDTIYYDNDTWIFHCDTIALRLEATVESDSLYGKYFQHGFRGKFGMHRSDSQEAEKFPFRTMELAIPVDSFEITGSLSLPEGEGPFPAALLISGSGQQDRDENVRGFRVFYQLAIDLNGMGYAVFRYDDRGTGNSGGFHEGLTTADFTVDAGIILDSLKHNPHLDPERIGVLGHSEGGIVAGSLGAERSDLPWVIMMAGPSLPGKDIILLQTEYIMDINGATEKEIEEEMALSNRLFNMVETESWDTIQQILFNASLASWKDLPKTVRKQYKDSEEFAQSIADIKLNALRSAWYRYFIAYDPMDDLRTLRCPALLIFGGKDLQVPANENLAAVIAAGLTKEGSGKVHTALIPGANHLFQEAETGNPTEYSSLPYQFDPAFLELISDWLHTLH